MTWDLRMFCSLQQYFGEAQFLGQFSMSFRAYWFSSLPFFPIQQADPLSRMAGGNTNLKFSMWWNRVCHWSPFTVLPKHIHDFPKWERERRFWTCQDKVSKWYFKPPNLLLKSPLPSPPIILISKLYFHKLFIRFTLGYKFGKREGKSFLFRSHAAMPKSDAFPAKLTTLKLLYPGSFSPLIVCTYMLCTFYPHLLFVPFPLAFSAFHCFTLCNAVSSSLIFC